MRIVQVEIEVGMEVVVVVVVNDVDVVVVVGSEREMVVGVVRHEYGRRLVEMIASIIVSMVVAKVVESVVEIDRDWSHVGVRQEVEPSCSVADWSAPVSQEAELGHTADRVGTAVTETVDPEAQS